MPAAEQHAEAPFLHNGPSVVGMNLWTLGSLTALAALYAAVYEPRFLLRYALVLALALLLEGAYLFLAEGRIALRSGGSAVTAAILLSSIPTSMPWLPLFFALVAAIFLARMPTGAGKGLSLNPALIGRLFLMLAFNQEIVHWVGSVAPLDGMTGATPLEVFHEEDSVQAMLSVGLLATGRIRGIWGGLYQYVPGGPGEAFTPVILLVGAVLVWRGVLDWRAGTAFLLSFAITCAGLYTPMAADVVRETHNGVPIAPFATTLGHIVLFNLLSGSVVFAAVFIAGDPRSTPATKAGRLLAGLIAGVADALIRRYTQYSEGIVFSFLLVNLLSPTLDRVCYTLRGRALRRRQSRLQKPA